MVNNKIIFFLLLFLVLKYSFTYSFSVQCTYKSFLPPLNSIAGLIKSVWCKEIKKIKDIKKKKKKKRKAAELQGEEE